MQPSAGQRGKERISGGSSSELRGQIRTVGKNKSFEFFEASETTANDQFLPNNKPNFFTFNQVIIVVCVP